MVDPILKWAGGKRQLLADITALFPVTYQAYHEPFVGGGAVFFHLDPDVGTINDLNERLTTFYEVVRDYPDQLIAENKTHEYAEEYFYQAREKFNRALSQSTVTREGRIQEASLLLYLNRTCFNGLYRENSDGESTSRLAGTQIQTGCRNNGSARRPVAYRGRMCSTRILTMC